MTLLYQPRAGAVVRCDFRGMIEPEMVKLRDVVVLMPHKQNRQLVTVVPLSTTPPTPPQLYHHELTKDPRPDGDTMRSVWAKCDMNSSTAWQAWLRRRSSRAQRMAWRMLVADNCGIMRGWRPDLPVQ